MIPPMKPGDRARMCPHLEAVIRQNQPMPHVWNEQTDRGSWAFVCQECSDAARALRISLDEQISRAKTEQHPAARK